MTLPSHDSPKPGAHPCSKIQQGVGGSRFALLATRYSLKLLRQRLFRSAYPASAVACVCSQLRITFARIAAMQTLVHRRRAAGRTQPSPSALATNGGDTSTPVCSGAV
jgi:hypothetical protein